MGSRSRDRRLLVVVSSARREKKWPLGLYLACGYWASTVLCAAKTRVRRVCPAARATPSEFCRPNISCALQCHGLRFCFAVLGPKPYRPCALTSTTTIRPIPDEKLAQAFERMTPENVVTGLKVGVLGSRRVCCELFLGMGMWV